MNETIDVWYDYQLKGLLPYRKLSSEILVQPELVINISFITI